MFQGNVFLPSQLWLLQPMWKNSNNNYDSVSVKMLTLALLSCWRQAPPPLYPITLSENCFFPSLKICKCVKVGYSQPPCLLFSLCCRIRGGGGWGWWGGRMKQDASLSRPLTRRSRQTCIAASSSLSAHWGTVPVTGVGGAARVRDSSSSLDAAKCRFSSWALLVTAAREDACKVKPTRSLQSNVQDKWRKHDTSFQKVTSSSLLCPDVSLWWKIQSAWSWWMNQRLCSMCSIQLLSKITSQVIYPYLKDKLLCVILFSWLINQLHVMCMVGNIWLP